MKKIISISLAVFLLGLGGLAFSAENTFPWGTAELMDIQYQPAKVVYDLTTGDDEAITRVMDRISYLNKLYDGNPFDGSIVVVIHGDAIPFFVGENYGRYEKIVTRAQSLSVGGTIRFRMCNAAAKVMGYKPSDVHGFVKMIPMADAEIIRLQQQHGYAYMK